MAYLKLLPKFFLSISSVRNVLSFYNENLKLKFNLGTSENVQQR